MISGLIQDLKLAVRLLRRKPALPRLPSYIRAEGSGCGSWICGCLYLYDGRPKSILWSRYVTNRKYWRER